MCDEDILKVILAGNGDEFFTALGLLSVQTYIRLYL